MELLVIVAFISGVKCTLNAPNTIIPCFLRSTSSLLFHTTDTQSFISSLVILPSDWYVSNSFRWLLSFVLQFGIMYCGSLLASLNATGMKVAHILALPEVVITTVFASSPTV